MFFFGNSEEKKEKELREDLMKKLNAVHDLQGKPNGAVEEFNAREGFNKYIQDICSNQSSNEANITKIRFANVLLKLSADESGNFFKFLDESVKKSLYNMMGKDTNEVHDYSPVPRTYGSKNPMSSSVAMTVTKILSNVKYNSLRDSVKPKSVKPGNSGNTGNGTG